MSTKRLPLSVRRSTEVDIEDVARLVLALYAEIQHDVPAETVYAATREFLHEHNAFAVLAFESDAPKPAGLLTLIESAAIYAAGRFGIIQELYVVGGKRGLGVGALLLDEAKVIGRELGWSRIEVTATAEDLLPESAAFYRHKRFDESGPRFKFELR